MASRKAPKLRLSLVFSLIIHVALIAVLVLGAYTYTTSLAGDHGNSLNAVMVDPSIMSEQNQRLLKQKAALEQRKQQRKAQNQAKAALLEKQKQAEQQRLKELERERLAALKTQQAQMAAAKAAIAEKKRAEEAALQAKARLAEQQQKVHAEVEQAKKVAEAQRLKAAEEAAKAQEVDDILGDLTSEKPAQQQGVKQAEIAHFISAVQSAISNKFSNPGIYNGQGCELRITIAPDGVLLDVKTQNASSLCRAAEVAIKRAKLPKPSSDALYKKVKNSTVVFKPQLK